MNEFTKEELNQLWIWGDIVLEHDDRPLVHQYVMSMQNKIKSMIDNYCEHNGEIGKDYPGEKCMKCNRMWE